MATVVAFVLIMSCIVLYIMTNLIRGERGGTGQLDLTGTASLLPTASLTSSPVPDTPTPHTPTETSAPDAPFLVDATWTPVPGRGKHVTFRYWYVRPNKVQVGECLQLTWDTENAASLQLFRDGELILEDAPASKTLQDCPKTVGYAVYRLVALNRVGESNWIQLQVKVVEAP